ncbi:MAG: DUF86 domain-containing protein [Pseudomonadota bacterium]
MSRRDDLVRLPGVAWPQIVSLRNRLIHGYDSVDMDILWQILQQDIPTLIAEMEKAVSTEPEG